MEAENKSKKPSEQSSREENQAFQKMALLYRAMQQAQTEQETKPTSGPAVEPMPIDKEGEPVFALVTPERGHAYIFGESGLDRAKGKQFVKNNIEKAKANLDKLKKKEPTIGTSIAKYNKQMAEWQEKLAQAQQELDYWNSVNDVQQRIEAAEAAEAALSRMSSPRASMREEWLCLSPLDDSWESESDLLQETEANREEQPESNRIEGVSER